MRKRKDLEIKLIHLFGSLLFADQFHDFPPDLCKFIPYQIEAFPRRTDGERGNITITARNTLNRLSGQPYHFLLKRPHRQCLHRTIGGNKIIGKPKCTCLIFFNYTKFLKQCQ